MAIAPRVTKLYLRDVQGVDALALRSMMDGGMVEIIVNVQEAAEWGDTLGRFFDKLEQDCEGWRDSMRNKTVIVNFVDPH